MRQRVTHCPLGHHLVGANLVPAALRRRKRACQTCNRARARLSYWRRSGSEVLSIEATVVGVLVDYPEMAEAALS